MYQRSAFIFRRDLRLHDNTGLIHALERSQQLLCCFIFDPRQIASNPYFSTNGFQFMLESLEELAHELRSIGAQLYFFHGPAEQICERLIRELRIDAIFFNRDYTHFSRSRDQAIFEMAKNLGTAVHQIADCLLNEPEAALKSDGKPYTIFTPYYKRCIQIELRKIKTLPSGHFVTDAVDFSDQTLPQNFLSQRSNSHAQVGGRNNGLKLLRDLETHVNYKQTRDFPALQGTSRLSAHNKFGTLSIREVAHAISKNCGQQHELLRQLYWRDFFTHIAFHFPHVFEGAFHKIYDRIEWSEDQGDFENWCNGQTGFPIVDAGMRELNQSGFMHNRVRMIVASFLTKDLHISWRQGERYFANKLCDYDPCVNNGSWQWAASTGCDAQPYFRIFNPWLQQEKFDTNCEYIKKWVPQLRSLTAKQIHALHKDTAVRPINYPAAIVDHQESKIIATEMLAAVKD